MRKGHWCTCQWLDIMSRMSREVHVRFWESAEVRSLRATRQKHKPVTATINVSFTLYNGHWNSNI